MDFLIGLLYLVGGNVRASASALRVARELLPIASWGAVYMALGVVLGVAVFLPRRRLVALVRVVGPTLYVMWSLIQLINAVSVPTAAIVGVPIYAYLAYRHSFAPVPEDRGRGDGGVRQC